MSETPDTFAQLAEQLVQTPDCDNDPVTGCFARGQCWAKHADCVRDYKRLCDAHAAGYRAGIEAAAKMAGERADRHYREADKRDFGYDLIRGNEAQMIVALIRALLPATPAGQGDGGGTP